MINIRQNVRRAAAAVGYDISRFKPGNHVAAQKRHLLHQHGIDLILDVGANVGQFGSLMRNEAGYDGRIVSFEPLAGAYQRLQSACAGDPAWQAHNYGLGEHAGFVDINVAANSVSSSLLTMLPALEQAAPSATYSGRERIEIRTIDAVADGIIGPCRNIYLKIDTQGYESSVLRGALATLPRIAMIQLELSLVPLYDGEPLMDEMHMLLVGLGYRLVALEPGFVHDRSGALMQLDGIYRRNGA